MDIGFIGLGNMGAPMAANLLRAGHRVTGFDAAGVSVPGADVAGSVAEAAAGRDAVITMLPDAAALVAVAQAAIPAARAGALFIDCSTVDVQSAREVAASAAIVGLRPLDTPVSGGTGGAHAGTLTFMVGGDAADLAAAQPLLTAMGRRVVHCGPAGNGQAAKICNNMILGISMIAVCEAFVLADRLGLDRQAMYDVASTSSGQCWALTTYCPAPGVGPQSPADNDYRPGFSSALMLKDLGLAADAIKATGAPLVFGILSASSYQDLVDSGCANRDFSYMLPFIASRAG